MPKGATSDSGRKIAHSRWRHDGRFEECSICNLSKEEKATRKRELAVLYNETHREGRRGAQRLYFRIKHGIVGATDEQKVDICEVCGNGPQVLCCDHDHSTGKRSGWLCKKCNLALGMCGDSRDVVCRLLAYLDKY